MKRFEKCEWVLFIITDTIANAKICVVITGLVVKDVIKIISIIGITTCNTITTTKTTTTTITTKNTIIITTIITLNSASPFITIIK